MTTTDTVDRQTARLIADAIEQHPRFEELFTGLAGVTAWLDRARDHYLAEASRTGVEQARQQIAQIVDDAALTKAG